MRRKDGSLTSRAMLCTFSTSAYSGRKADKKATREIREWHQITEEKVIEAKKRTFPEDAPSYKAITAIIGKGRDAFHEETLPWLQNGTGILPAANFMHCTERFNVLEREFYQALPAFFEEWPQLVEQAQGILKTLFDPTDYPPLAKLKKRFSFGIKIFPMPDESDFRADIPDDQLDVIKIEMAANIENTVKQSMMEPYSQLWDAVAHMASRLQAQTTCPCRKCKGKTFKSDQFGDSLVENVAEVCERLPRLNLLADPKLDEMILVVKASLTTIAPDLLRGNEEVKKSLAERAQAIRDEMSVFFPSAA